MFDEATTKELAAVLDKDNVKTRGGANRQVLSYVEGWQVIEEANRLFGFGNWSRETVMLEPLHEPVMCKDKDDPQAGKIVSCFFAKVRITVFNGEHSKSVVREGCGAARGFAKTAGEAMEHAIKSAETDATKRAMVTFGNAFGLALYDKSQSRIGTREDLPQVTDQSSRPLAAIDVGFDDAQQAQVAQAPRLTTSQRALQAAGSRLNGRVTARVGDLPV